MNNYVYEKIEGCDVDMLEDRTRWIAILIASKAGWCDNYITVQS